MAETIFQKPLDAQVASNTDAITNIKNVPTTLFSGSMTAGTTYQLSESIFNFSELVIMNNFYDNSLINNAIVPVVDRTIILTARDINGTDAIKISLKFTDSTHVQCINKGQTGNWDVYVLQIFGVTRK